MALIREFTTLAEMFLGVTGHFKGAKRPAFSRKIDGVYVGPSDLSMSLGKPPTLDPSDAEVVSLIELIAKKTRAKGLIAGVHCDGSKTALRRFGQGYQLATILNDARLMATAAAQAVKEVKGGAPVAAPKTY